MNCTKHTLSILPFFLLLIVSVSPDNAWAVQSHGAPEGLYVHQLAHIFFTASMCYLLWGIRQSSFKSKGWRYLQVFCVFMAMWNVVAFTGHSLAPYIHNSDFIRESGYLSTKLVGPFTSVKIGFYITKLDHLLSIPSLFFLYLAMKNIYRSSCEEEKV